MVLIGLLIVLVNWNTLPPELPWLYSLPWGEGQLVTKMFLVWLSLVELLVWIGVLWMAKRIKFGDLELATAIQVGGFVALLITLASLLRVVTIFTKWRF
jgi:hypothetical protein